MPAEQAPADPSSQRIDYDPEVVITRLAGQLTAALVEGARLEAIVRSLATENASQAAQLAEQHGKPAAAAQEGPQA